MRCLHDAAKISKRICETHVITDYTIQTFPFCLNPGSNWGPCVTSNRRAGATMRWWQGIISLYIKLLDQRSPAWRREICVSIGVVYCLSHRPHCPAPAATYIHGGLVLLSVVTCTVSVLACVRVRIDSSKFVLGPALLSGVRAQHVRVALAILTSKFIRISSALPSERGCPYTIERRGTSTCALQQ